MTFWISKIILILICFAFLVFFNKLRRLIFFEKRLKRYSVYNVREDISFMDRVDFRVTKFLNRFLDNKKIDKNSFLYKRYLNYGNHDDAFLFLLHKLMIGIVFTVLVVISSLLSGYFASFLVIIISFAIGYYFYDIYLYVSFKVKRKRIKNDLLRAVILMNNSFKAGKSIMQSVLIASEELDKPISLEFKRIYQDMFYGLSADVAFQRFSSRVNLEEANYISSSLTILNKTGGNIVSVFSSIERTLFDKKKLENDLKSSAAASNFVVKFLMCVPVLFVFLIYIVSPGYFEPLFTSVLGYFIIFIIFILFISFIYLLNRIMKVKV